MYWKKKHIFFKVSNCFNKNFVVLFLLYYKNDYINNVLILIQYFFEKYVIFLIFTLAVSTETNA